MKLKVMQLAVLVAVLSGSIITVNAKTVESKDITLVAGVSAEISNIIDNKEVLTDRGLIEQLNNLSKNVKEEDISIEQNEVVIVKSSLEDIKDTDNKDNKKEEKATGIVKVDVEVKDLSKTVYIKSKANVREMPTIESGVLEKYNQGKKVEVTGEVGDWYRIKYKDGDAFVSKDMCTDTKPETENKSGNKKDASDTYNPDWDGKKLTKQAGTVMGPSGKETYYNLPMGGIVSRLKRLGYKGDYWVREDGVKMFGDYILVAASFDIRPIGTILPTSLGMGIVADTGGFAKHNKYQLDIATAW